MTCCKADASARQLIVSRQRSSSESAHAWRPRRAELLRQPLLLSRILHAAERVRQQQHGARLRQHWERAFSSSALNKGRKST